MIISFGCQVLTVLSYRLQCMVRLRDTAEKQVALSVCHVTRDTKSIQTVHRLGAVKQTSSGLGLIQYVNVRANVFSFFQSTQIVRETTGCSCSGSKFPLFFILFKMQWN